MGELGQSRVGIRSAQGFSPLGDGRRGKERASPWGSVSKDGQGIWGRKRTQWDSLVLNGGWTQLSTTPKELLWG